MNIIYCLILERAIIGITHYNFETCSPKRSKTLIEKLCGTFAH